jgi:hypothetical protein
MDKNKEQKIREKISEFIIRTQKKYEELNKEDMAINPFLASVLKLDKEAALKFFLTQRLQRGIVTSFGSLLQEIAKILDSEAKKEDVDLVVKKNNKIHYVQLKSGPEGFTRPALRKTKAAFDKLKKDNPACVTTIAFCYGVENQLSKIWGKELYKSADIVLVGKEFWDYFFGDGCYNELIKIFETITLLDNKSGIQRKSFDQIFETAYRRISK